MFDGTSAWDGDPDKLNESQLTVLISKLEQETTARKAQQAQLSATEQIIDVMCTPGTAIVRT